MLDIGGKPCKTEPGFDQDLCTESQLDKKLLIKFGCTSPFGPNKDKICKDHENGSKVMELYKDTMKYHRSGLYFRGLTNGIDNNCYSPCLFHSVKALKTNQFDRNVTSMVYMKLKENINVIESYHLYSALSLVDEIGGYVGLS